MGNMSYCRHENTANDLQDVQEQWWDFDEDTASEYEKRGRKRIVDLVAEMYADFVDEGLIAEED